MKQLILIVDDEKSNRHTLARVLRREGYDTIEACDGKEALLRLEEQPLLMITDLKMPQLNGLELLSLAKEMHG